MASRIILYGFDLVLLLCHTPKDDLQGCPTAGLPISLSWLRHANTADINTSVKDEQDHHHVLDITARPMSRPLAKTLHGKFDIITTVCCPFDVFIQVNGDGINLSAWKNVADTLKPGGFFMFSTALMGLESLALYFKAKTKQTKKQTTKLLATLSTYIDSLGNLELQSVPLTSQGPFEKWWTQFVSQYCSRNYGVSGFHSSIAEIRDDNIIVFMRT